jgi:peptidoglycan/LPS O-acetylase OafA/YrhL
MGSSRPPATNRSHGYIASLTGLRGIAAFSVFLFHYSALHPGIRLDLSVPLVGFFLQMPLGLGFAGVDLFFVLSGFLLSLPFAGASLALNARPSTGHYLKRRLSRVFPAYYAQLLIILLASAWFVTWKPLDGTSLLAHLVMFFNLGPAPVRPLVGLWWTLPVELSFYLLLPLIASFMRPRRWLFFIFGGFVLSMAYRYWSASAFGEVTGDVVFLNASQLPGSLPEFLLGASAAMLVRWVDAGNFRSPTTRGADTLFVVGLVLTLLWLGGIVLTFGPVYWAGHWSMIIAPVALGVTLTVMVLGLYWGSRLGALLCANPVVYFIGLISYSLYLWHFVVMQQVQKIGGESYAAFPGLVKFLLCTLLVTAVAATSYFLFERPFFRLRGKRGAG